MAGGKRFKFQGSTIAVLTDYDAASPSQAITAITKADPAVVTSTAHGLSDGDVVRIFGVGGMVEVNNTSFIVDVINSSTFSLVDTDSTGYGTYTSGGHFDRATFSNFCELTGWNRTGGTSPEIDATTICSDFKEYEVGLPDTGSAQIDYNFAPQTTIQLAIAAFDKSKDLTAVQIILPNAGGLRTVLGFVQQTSERASVGTLWTANVTFKITGAPFDVAHV
jgi:hypothetical protein